MRVYASFAFWLVGRERLGGHQLPVPYREVMEEMAVKHSAPRYVGATVR